ncbi:MAG: hypothetical protein WBP08_02260 [Saprospiraceae bacterium]
MNLGKIFLLFFSAIFGFSQINAQVDSTKYINSSITSFGFGMGADLPGGDLSIRYGSNLNFALQGEYITSANWIFGSELLFIFGANVKEDVLAPFRTSTGVILGDDNQIADVFLRQRGIFIGAGIGRLIQFNRESRSGIKFNLHAGILQHHIRFADERNSVAQIRAGRHIGYDRLTRGFSLKESVGYKHLSHDRRLNFEFMFDFIQGFTSEVRAFNFDTGLASIPSRLDLMFGIRIVWNLPFYHGGSEAAIYY